MDTVYAEKSHFGGLIASGIHTLAVAIRLMMQSRTFAPEIFLGCPGVDELRWLHPVRPGDTIRAAGEVLETRTSRSKPDQGVVRYLLEVLNQGQTSNRAYEVGKPVRCLAILKRTPDRHSKHR